VTPSARRRAGPKPRTGDPSKVAELEAQLALLRRWETDDPSPTACLYRELLARCGPPHLEPATGNARRTPAAEEASP